MSVPQGALTPSFVFDLESRMRTITSNEYQRLVADLWSPKVVKEVQTQSAKELMHWFLDTAQIEYTEEGAIEFEELAMKQTSFDSDFASKGLKMLRSKFEDLDGNGVRVAAEWSRQIGAQIAYWPQEQAAAALKAGTAATSLAYDGLPFFSASHLVNPLDSSKGTYSNLHTTGVKLDDRHTIETAIESFGLIRAALADIKMPNGSQPRKLRPLMFLAPPRMMDRLNLITKAKFIGIDGSTDVTAITGSWGLQPPIQVDEISAALGGSDTDCYLVCAQLTGDDLGGLVYLNREPFAINYYSGQGAGATGLDAVLNRTRELEWHVQGRNKMHYGHPYLIHKLVGQAP